MTIRKRLLLWYFSVTFVIVLLFSLGSYWGMSKLLFRALDEELMIIVDEVKLQYNPSERIFEFTRDDPGSALQRYNPFYLLVYDREGIPVFLSPMAQKLSLRIPLQRGETKVGYTVKRVVPSDVPFVHPNEQGEVTFRVIVHKLHHHDETTGWVVVALPMERIEESMQHLLQVLLVGIPLAVLLIGICGYYLAGKVLRPIDTITTKADYISYRNLDERIEVRNKKDELGRLAIVLNNLFERLHKSFESQKLFLADAAHELKTPLSVLRTHWEGELNNPDLTMEFKEKLLQDVETITRLNHLINNLLLLSRTESIQASFDFSPLQLEEIIEEVVSDARILAEIKSQKISVDIIKPATIIGDKHRLYQMFFNIIDNAIKYTPNGGNVWIKMEVQGKLAVVTISDDGIGITEEDLPHIFERFFRVDKDRARKTGGSGLGLAICKLIAELHDGDIDVSSRAGSGTLFSLSFKCA